jgi:uncharacterized protein (TIGR03435 family)
MRVLMGAVITVVLIVGTLMFFAKRSHVIRSPAPPVNTSDVPIGVELCHSKGFSLTRVPDKQYPEREIAETDAKLTMLNSSLTSLLVWTYDVYPCRFEMSQNVPDSLYSGTLPSDSDTPDGALQQTVAQAMREAFHLNVSLQPEQADVWILTCPASGKVKGLTLAAPKTPASRATVHTGMAFQGTTVADLCDWMEQQMDDLPVVDETHLEGSFNFILDDKAVFDSKAIPDAVRSLGFNLTRASRSIQKLVIEPIPAK